MEDVKNFDYKERLWTPQEVAEKTRRTVDTVYRWIHEGRFETVIRIIDGYLIPDSEIKKIIEILKSEDFLL